MESVSTDVINSELLLFQPIRVNRGVEKIQYIEYHPVNQITAGAPVEFCVPGTGSHYIDLKRCRLYVKACIKKRDGTNLDEKDLVAPCNMFLQSLWSQTDVFLQQRLCSSGSSGHPYRAMFDTLLNFGPQALESQFQSQLFYKDTADGIETTDPVNGVPVNEGLIRRYKLGRLSQWIDMEGPVYADLMQMDRYLLNGVELRLKLHQSCNEFRLMAKNPENKYSVVIQDVIFKACMIKISPEVITGHAAALTKTPALYPYVRTELKAFAVPKGNYQATIDDVFLGNVPNRVVIAMVSGNSYSGSYTLNPFNLQHFNINFLSVSIDGQSVPGKPLQPKFSEENGQNYVTAYQSIFAGLRKEDLDEGIYANRNEYPSGYTMFVFDLGAHMDELNFQPSLTRGNLKLEARFESPLKDPINLIVYASFPSLLRIDQSRNVLL